MNRYHFTCADLAAAVGWDLGQVQRSHRAGQFDMRDFASVLAWLDLARAGQVKPTRKRYGKERRGVGSGA